MSDNGAMSSRRGARRSGPAEPFYFGSSAMAKLHYGGTRCRKRWRARIQKSETSLQGRLHDARREPRPGVRSRTRAGDQGRLWLPSHGPGVSGHNAPKTMSRNGPLSSPRGVGRNAGRAPTSTPRSAPRYRVLTGARVARTN